MYAESISFTVSITHNRSAWYGMHTSRLGWSILSHRPELGPNTDSAELTREFKFAELMGVQCRRVWVVISKLTRCRHYGILPGWSMAISKRKLLAVDAHICEYLLKRGSSIITQVSPEYIETTGTITLWNMAAGICQKWRMWFKQLKPDDSINHTGEFSSPMDSIQMTQSNKLKILFGVFM